MADKVRLRCPALGYPLVLPVWPDDVTNVLPSWSVSTLERPGKRPLDVPSARTVEERTLGFTLRNTDYRQSIAPLLNDLRIIARSKKPFSLLMGDQDTGLWRMDPPQITVTAYANDGSPSVADVSLTLKRASDAAINVGLAKRVRGSGTGFATRG